MIKNPDPNIVQPRKIFDFATILMAGLLIFNLFYLVIFPTNVTSPIRDAILRRSTWSRDQVKPIDKVIAAMPEGNIYIHYTGFDPKNLGQELFVGIYTPRSAYSIYPRKVFTNSSGSKVIYYTDLLREPVLPSNDWMKAHAIKYVLILEKKLGERVSPQIRKVD